MFSIQTHSTTSTKFGILSRPTNPGAADRVLEEILETIRALVPHPQLGHRRTDLTSRPLRFHPVRELLIAYAAEETPLVVLAVLHGRRNPRVIAALLRERR